MAKEFGFSGQMTSLVSFDISHIPFIQVDALVIGSGVAGLRAAVEAARYGRVLILSKCSLTEGNSFRAQGGIAVSLSREDSTDTHIKDTIDVGVRLCDNEAVKTLVEEGVVCVKELIGWGAEFDKKRGRFLFTKEGGHSVRRIIHAQGDATGAEVERTLLRTIGRCPNIKWIEGAFVIDLVIKDGRCFGAIFHAQDRIKAVFSKATILASGGIGCIYRETTNSPVTTGDGIAMAYRGGAVVSDIEFIQFHPTTLYLPGASRVLITEAIRGEGGVLRNRFGEAFMSNYHKMGDLAPRDVVSRAILDEMQRTGDTHVYLDVSRLGKRFLARRFPNIMAICRSFGISLPHEWIPVRPTAHYLIGGIKVDLFGCTNIDRLYACGEVASTGVHGANRLASNSLLECLVWGKRAGGRAGKDISSRKFRRIKTVSKTPYYSRVSLEEVDLQDLRNSLRSLVWRDLGVVRSGEGMERAEQELCKWGSYALNIEFSHPQGWELQNGFTVARLILRAAALRTESRGVHYRVDFPSPDDKTWRKHIELKMGEGDEILVTTSPVC